MASIFGSHTSHCDAVHCSKCGTDGTIVWNELGGQDNVSREFVRIVGDFYERLRNKPPYPIELVCNICGTAQTSQLQP